MRGRPKFCRHITELQGANRVLPKDPLPYIPSRNCARGTPNKLDLPIAVL
jgi:hypothetical protein